MRAVAKRLYKEPVVFLGVVQLVLTGLAAEGVITGWAPVVSLAVVTYLQRELVRPRKVRK